MARIDPARRAKIGRERRRRTRARLLDSAFRMFGRTHGRNTRIEDICAAAGVARGTFYTYYKGLEPLLQELSRQLTRDFNREVHAALRRLPDAVERTSAAVRYFLHATVAYPRWGWALVNSSVGRHLYGAALARLALASIQEGIDSGEFRLPGAEVGRDLVLGAGFAASISLLRGPTPPDYAEQVARQLLIGLGVPSIKARSVAARSLQILPAPAFITQGSARGASALAHSQRR
jgi:AcrR family transcriptional regulator